MVTKESLKIFRALFTSLVDRASKFEDGKAATMPHRERLGSHPWSRSHRPRIRGGQRDIKTKYGGTRRVLRAYLDQLEQAPER